MNSPDHDQGINSFADVVSNLLAIFIVVILLMALSVGYVSKKKQSKQSEIPATSVFKTSKREWFPPWSEFFIVADNRIVKWDLQKTVTQFKSISDTRQATLKLSNESGELTLMNFGSNGDIDSYYLNYMINWKWFARAEQYYDMDTIKLFFEHISLSQNCVPAFFVYPTGMKLFSKIHDRLRKKDIRFRWHTGNPKKAIALYRHRSQFSVKEFYYQ